MTSRECPSGTRIKRIVTDFDGSIRSDPSPSVKSVYHLVLASIYPQWRPGCRELLSCMVSIPGHLFNQFFASNIAIRYQGIELQIPVIYISPFNSPPLDVSRLPPASRHG